MLKKTVLHLAIAAALLSAAGTLLAASARPANVAVSATVSKACSITATSAVAFGNYDPIGANATTAVTATGSISVACSKGATGMTIALSNGTNGTGTQRSMLLTTPAGTDKLDYALGQPPSNLPATACTFGTVIPWTDTAMLTLGTTPSKAVQVYNVCGTIAAGQDVPAGIYSDTVVATLNF